jgi:3-oxoacyl-[acyl-carrier protein] reductase
MRNVLVTGGSRGIGLAIARRLAASGDYNVVVVARRESSEFAAAAAEAQRRLHFRACDLAVIESIPIFAKSVRDEFGTIYGLVNNAGIGTDGLLATMHNSEIEALIRLNVLSPIILTKYVARHMMASGAGRIVNISSIVASTGYSGLSVYAASKAAVAGFTRSLAREVGRVGITVNAVAPGFIDTAASQEMDNPLRQAQRQRTPLGRFGRPEEIAATVAFLASDDAAFYVGETLSPNGGIVTV